mmetsp:Transcript_3859/g.15954  ORF Transcript_3859/g.15954 Transcript_3859/m.15954 type:complete len:536 (+) Transcript_3859:4491-6098(+)
MRALPRIFRARLAPRATSPPRPVRRCASLALPGRTARPTRSRCAARGSGVLAGPRLASRATRASSARRAPRPLPLQDLRSRWASGSTPTWLLPCNLAPSAHLATRRAARPATPPASPAQRATFAAQGPAPAEVAPGPSAERATSARRRPSPRSLAPLAHTCPSRARTLLETASPALRAASATAWAPPRQLSATPGTCAQQARPIEWATPVRRGPTRRPQTFPASLSACLARAAPIAPAPPLHPGSALPARTIRTSAAPVWPLASRATLEPPALRPACRRRRTRARLATSARQARRPRPPTPALPGRGRIPRLACPRKSARFARRAWRACAARPRAAPARRPLPALPGIIALLGRSSPPKTPALRGRSRPSETFPMPPSAPSALRECSASAGSRGRADLAATAATARPEPRPQTSSLAPRARLQTPRRLRPSPSARLARRAAFASRGQPCRRRAWRALTARRTAPGPHTEALGPEQARACSPRRSAASAQEATAARPEPWIRCRAGLAFIAPMAKALACLAPRATTALEQTPRRLQ